MEIKFFTFMELWDFLRIGYRVPVCTCLHGMYTYMPCVCVCVCLVCALCLMGVGGACVCEPPLLFVCTAIEVCNLTSHMFLHCMLICVCVCACVCVCGCMCVCASIVTWNVQIDQGNSWFFF